VSFSQGDRRQGFFIWTSLVWEQQAAREFLEETDSRPGHQTAATGWQMKMYTIMVTLCKGQGQMQTLYLVVTALPTTIQ